jgi:osmotically-inducible protein OsmY
MLDHLLDFDPEVEETESSEGTALTDADPTTLLAAQQSTADWLASMGAPTTEQAQTSAASLQAQKAFTALSVGVPEAQQRTALLQMNTPPAVRKLVGMLTAYDWAFVEQAKELRGYAVSQILEETKHPDARIRLRALDMLGRVTEVALFTDRMEIKKTELSDKEIDEKIKEKLNRFMGVVDATPVDVETKAQTPVDVETKIQAPDETA